MKKNIIFIITLFSITIQKNIASSLSSKDETFINSLDCFKSCLVNPISKPPKPKLLNTSECKNIVPKFIISQIQTEKPNDIDLHKKINQFISKNPTLLLQLIKEIKKKKKLIKSEIEKIELMKSGIENTKSNEKYLKEYLNNQYILLNKAIQCSLPKKNTAPATHSLHIQNLKNPLSNQNFLFPLKSNTTTTLIKEINKLQQYNQKILLKNYTNSVNKRYENYIKQQLNYSTKAPHYKENITTLDEMLSKEHGYTLTYLENIKNLFNHLKDSKDTEKYFQRLDFINNELAESSNSSNDTENDTGASFDYFFGIKNSPTNMEPSNKTAIFKQ